VIYNQDDYTIFQPLLTKYRYPMKKLLSALVISATVLFSCSKEAKLNRKIDGEWNVTTIDSEPLVSESIVFKFEKDKKGEGNVLITETGTTSNQAGSTTYTGTYTLNEDTEINTILTSDGGTQSLKFIVSEYDNNTMKLVDEDASIYELEKK